MWQLRERPEKLLVLGGGPIGCELAQCFQRLGSQVTMVERNPHILSREDEEIASMVMQQFRDDGITLLTAHQAQRFVTLDGKPSLVCESHGKEVSVEFDKVLIALGRKANVTGFGLESLQVQLSARGTIEADPFLRTRPGMWR